MDMFETSLDTTSSKLVLHVNPQQTWISDDWTWVNPHYIEPQEDYQLHPADTDTLNFDAQTGLLIPDQSAFPASSCDMPAPIPFWAWTRIYNLKVTVKPSPRGPLFQALYSGQVIAAATCENKTGPNWACLNQYQDDIVRLARPLEGTRLNPYEAWWAAGFLIWGQAQTRK